MINWINKFLDLFFFLCVATSTDTLVSLSDKTRLEPNVPQGSPYKVAEVLEGVRLSDLEVMALALAAWSFYPFRSLLSVKTNFANSSARKGHLFLIQVWFVLDGQRWRSGESASTTILRFPDGRRYNITNMNEYLFSFAAFLATPKGVM